MLPEDRADVLYFRYDGGGVIISGPSMLVRKSIGEHVSVQANHYIDMVSSASIDVETSASPYDDERTQSSLSVDILHGKSTYTLGAVKSDESDYLANTAFVGVSHDMFGDLTTIGFGYKKGQNDVFRNVKIDGVKQRDPSFASEMESQSFNVSLSQIITKNLIVSGQYEVVTDEGFLRSPYRQVRFFIGPDSAGPGIRDLSEHALEQRRVGPRQVLPALSRRHRHHVPVLHGHLGRHRPHRRDSATCIRSTRPGPAATGSSKAACATTRRPRPISTSDIFPRAGFANFMARDKELATYNAITAGVTATYEFKLPRFPWLSKGSLNFRYDYMTVNYDNFRDATFSLGRFGVPPAEAMLPGTEPSTSSTRTSSSSSFPRSSKRRFNPS